MKVSIKEIKKAYLDKNRYAQISSSSGIVELSRLVKELCIQYYTDIQTLERKKDNNTKIYLFLQEKISEIRLFR